MIAIVAVGRMKAGPLATLCDTYLKRIVWPLALTEVEARGNPSGALLKIREAEAIRARLPQRGRLIALDERGRELSSQAFADYLQTCRDIAPGSVTFIVGGADGLDEALRAQADLSLSLGAMTWPHMLARTMLLEQIYRAQQIQSGHPYHRA